MNNGRKILYPNVPVGVEIGGMEDFRPETITGFNWSADHGIVYERESPVGLWGPKRDPLYVVVPITVYYVIVFVSGVVGNVSTCVVIARNKHMHTATNYYLFSLAISDLLLLFSGLPPEIYHIWSNYPYVFGETLCVLFGFGSETSANATVLTITAFTVERYIAICHPFLSQTVSKLSRAVKYIVLIWVVSLFLAFPQAIQMGLVYETDDNGDIVSEEYTSCTIKHSYIPYSFFLSAILFFLTPMTLITVFYVLIGVRLHRSSQITRGTSKKQCSLSPGSKDREAKICVRGSQRNGQPSKSTKRVVKMLVAVVVAFFICWAPFQVQRLHAIYGFHGDNTTSTDILVYKVMTYASGVLYYLSTTINPILYNIMSLKFRQAFRITLTRCLARNGLRRSGDLASSGGGVSLEAGRLNYAAISRCSFRNNNNSGSSGNSSYVETATDLSRRPLVVSFRRRSGRTSTTSLNTADRKQCCGGDLVNVPEVSVSTPSEGYHPCPTLTFAPVPQEPRIEDIEIFQEEQLKVHRPRRSKTTRSCSVFRSDRCRPQYSNQLDQDSFRLVHKSYTVPCLVPR